VNASHPEGEPQPSSRNLSYTAAGILLGLVLLVVILFREQLSSINNVLAWMTCCALFVLAGYLDERQDDDLWHGYRGLAVMSAWLTQSLSAALGVLALGTALVLAIKYWRNKDAAWWRGALLQTAEFVVLALVPLLMSWLALAVLTGLPALDFIGSAATFATEMVVPLVGMLLAYFLAGQAARYMVARWRQQRFIALWNATQYGRLINEITLLPMILIGPIVYFTSGPGVFVMLLLMVMAFAYYQHQNAAAGQRSQAVYVQSADLLRKLALVNRTTQNALFRVDQDVALKTACQTAMAVTQSDRVAIWIADRDADTLMLAESINLPEGTLRRRWWWGCKTKPRRRASCGRFMRRCPQRPMRRCRCTPGMWCWGIWWCITASRIITAGVRWSCWKSWRTRSRRCRIMRICCGRWNSMRWI
jgi:hypothetical protein